MENGLDIITLGCRLNAAESETMRRIGAAAGVRDAVVVNTCAVTAEAVRHARQKIRRARRERPSSRIVVTGCAAQIDPDSFSQMQEVDVVLGNQEKLERAEWETVASNHPIPVRVNDIMSVRETAGHMIDGYGDRARAFLQIQNGCDHRCTFCIIPYGRGNARSACVDEIIEQARRFTDKGHRELVLTGVDITSWGADLEGRPTLGALVSALLEAVPNLFRLRLSSIDGAEIDQELFECITSNERVAPYLHLSLQSGDNMILKRMKRRHTREQVIDLCKAIRARRPEFAFGADIIAGFPTESGEMFQRSVDIIEEAGLQFIHAFPFSPREGTPAARMPQLPREVVKNRAARLRAAGQAALHKFFISLVGNEEDAVLESGGRARLGNFASVKLYAPNHLVGDVIRVAVNGTDGDSLLGKPVHDAQVA